MSAQSTRFSANTKYMFVLNTNNGENPIFSPCDTPIFTCKDLRELLCLPPSYEHADMYSYITIVLCDTNSLHDKAWVCNGNIKNYLSKDCTLTHYADNNIRSLTKNYRHKKSYITFYKTVITIKVVCIMVAQLFAQYVIRFWETRFRSHVLLWLRQMRIHILSQLLLVVSKAISSRATQNTSRHYSVNFYDLVVVDLLLRTTYI